MNRWVDLLVALLLSVSSALAQPSFTVPHGIFTDASVIVGIEAADAGAAIHYTTDGTEPTPQSVRYSVPLKLTKTTILRAVEVKDGMVVSPIATATYIFVASVLSQSNTPKGYPTTWGQYCQIGGTAKADYEMDPEMTSDPVLRLKIAEGLESLPVLSIVTAPDNLFSHDNDSERGGIYIFTGPPVGDNTGHGWTRPASVELFSPQAMVTARPHNQKNAEPYDLTASCGLRLHGGHGRLAEKNPKHSFRLVFKAEYGSKTLKYPLFGPDGPDAFNQLVLRCHFGNAWQHWSEANRQKAQYTRDVWARRMQRRLGRTSVDALYVNLFLNGMYWGVYNIAERVDEHFVSHYLGGEKADADVVKIEEDGGNHLEASEGNLDAWNLMAQTARTVGSNADAATRDEAYSKLSESLLDIDAFIDYMIINQYGGNTDWDHHNWYAVRRRGADSQGFRFLCWDSEIIFENERENVLTVNNGVDSPTGIFHSLLRNDDFARRYVRRAKELLAPDGLLGQNSVVELWDSLYTNISAALYCEAARWGDYRRDVHPWQSRGQLYTVDDTYMAERRRLLSQYFPVRADVVLNAITSYVGIDDFEAPDGWVPLTASMFREWYSTGIDAQPKDVSVNVDWHFNVNVSDGGAVAGFVGVAYNQFADLSDFEYLVLRGSGSGVRLLANRLVPSGPWKEISVAFNAADPYWDAAYEAVVFRLDDLKTIPTKREGTERTDDFVHLNAIKVDWGHSANVRAAYLVPRAGSSSVEYIAREGSSGRVLYDLQGRRVANPRRGLYIRRDGGKTYIYK